MHPDMQIGFKGRTLIFLPHALTQPTLAHHLATDKQPGSPALPIDQPARQFLLPGFCASFSSRSSILDAFLFIPAGFCHTEFWDQRLVVVVSNSINCGPLRPGK
jgi:hypothetical protein